MRRLTIWAVGVPAAALLLAAGCCGSGGGDVVSANAPEPVREPVVAAAPDPGSASQELREPQEQIAPYDERTGIKVSMYPLSSPPASAPLPPRMPPAPLPQPVYTASAPVSVYSPPPAGGEYRILDPRVAFIGDPPTITVSPSGQVIDSTESTYQYQPAGATYATAAAAPLIDSYSPAPGTTVYTATTTTTALEPVAMGSPVEIPVTTTVEETRTVTYSTPPSVSAVAPAVFYPDAVPPAAGEYRLVPATDIPPGVHPNDALPSQWFEIIRPGDAPIRIGRVSATCVCVRPMVPDRFIGQGERALIEARIVARPPRNNLTYGIFVNTIEPMAQTLDSDITVHW